MNEFTEMAIALFNARNEEHQIVRAPYEIDHKTLEHILQRLRDQLHAERSDYHILQTPGAQRIYSEEERALFDDGVQSLLQDFEKMDLITPAEREQIIDQIIIYNKPINEFQLRYLTFLVVAQPGESHDLENIWLGNVIAEYGHRGFIDEERH